MRYKITNDVIDFLSERIGKQRGAAADFVRRSGLHQQLISALLKGRHPVVQEDTWMRLCQAMPGLDERANPVVPIGGQVQSPVAVTSGSHSPATAVVNNAPQRPCADCRMKVLEAIREDDDR